MRRWICQKYCKGGRETQRRALEERERLDVPGPQNQLLDGCRPKWKPREDRIEPKDADWHCLA